MSKHRSQTKKCKKTRKSKSSRVNKSCKKQKGAGIFFDSDAEKIIKAINLNLTPNQISILKQGIFTTKLEDGLNAVKKTNYYNIVKEKISQLLIEKIRTLQDKNLSTFLTNFNITEQSIKDNLEKTHIPALIGGISQQSLQQSSQQSLRQYY